MDAYDMPDEFSHLQAQDMSKIGFIQDITRGVKKVLDAGKVVDSAKAVAPQTSSAALSAAAPGVESLMKRGHLFLEDSDWRQANEYFDRVLDIDPEYAPAYIGKLCAELNTRHEDDLGDCETLLSEKGNFQKAIRFSDAEYQERLKRYDERVRERMRQNQYNWLLQSKNKASTENEYQDIAKKFIAMNGYKDSEKLANECDNQFLESIYQRATKLMRNAQNAPDCLDAAEMYTEAKGLFDSICEYKEYKNSTELCMTCVDAIVQKLEEEKQQKQKREEERQRASRLAQWERDGRCRHCGGKIGLFKKCKSCGKPA
jgi:tetratricopeptide (TPR) repeat protein